MSSSRILPDPDKWVTTKKVERQPMQRPLVDARFRAHCGIATPPSTGGKRRAVATSSQSTVKRPRPSHVTPLAASKGEISAFLTPPTTGPTNLSRTSLAQLDINTRRSGRSCSPTKEAPPLVADGVNIEAWKASLVQEKDSPARNPRQPTVPVDTDPQPSTPYRPSLSQRQLTPVPDSVLARHKLLCGQDSARRRGVISPWRREEGVNRVSDEVLRAERAAERKAKEEERAVERERKRLRLDVREAVGNDTVERIRKVKERRNLGAFKSLAGLSSDRSSSPSCSSDSIPAVGKQKDTLRRHSSVLEPPVCGRDERWPQRQPKATKISSFSRHGLSGQIADNDAPRPTTEPTRPRYKLPTGTQTSPQPSPRTTPRKHRIAHHQVTPPKSRTPQRLDQHETLFVLPAPPKQPVFQPVIPPQESIQPWLPVAMEPETLVTWSLGQGEPRMKEKALAPPIEAAPHHAPSSDNDDVDSIAPSIPSQSFPVLIESSPTKLQHVDISKQATSPDTKGHRSSDTLAEADPDEPLSSSPSPVPAPRLPMAVPTPMCVGSTRRSPIPPPPSQRRKGKDATQTKLAAFGYFRSTARVTKDFESSFSDEDDLDFGINDAPALDRPETFSQGLQHVPEAPPHPELRPLGVREQSKRASKAMSRHRAQQIKSSGSSQTPTPPPQSTLDFTDTSSSLAEDDPRISESTKAWWDKLGASSMEDLSHL